MNEIRILYFGSVPDISSSLLYMLGVVEIRPACESQKGFFLIETRFGQESLRPLSLDITDSSAKDVLIYRYLSVKEREVLQLQLQPRRYFVLLHNLFNLEYITSEIRDLDPSRFNFLVDMSNNDFFKPFPYASRLLPSKNFYRIAKIKKTQKSESSATSAQFLPLFFLVLLKFLANPVNEIKRLVVLAKFSNLRVLSRALELVLFLDFVVRALIYHTVRLLGIRLFYRSAFVAGLVKIVSIKCAWFFRHIVLMSWYKTYGFGVDTYCFAVRMKDAFMATFYYRFLHRLYHKFIKPAGSMLIYKVIVEPYYLMLPKINFAILQLQIALRYRIPHYLVMFFYKTYGCCYDFAMFAFRFTKLVLLYPVRKLYWFARFQYEKRLKKFLV